MTRLVTPLANKLTAVLLLLMSMLGVFPLDVILPSFPALASNFDVSLKHIAFSVSIFAIGASISQLFIGPLSDVIGRKRLLQGGLVISIAGALGCVFSKSYEAFMLFRLVQAFGCGSFVLSQALVQDIYPADQQNALRILMLTVSGLFISLSPLAGSVLQHYLGWEGSFYIFSMLASIVLSVSLFWLSEKPVQFVRGSIAKNFKDLVVDRAFLVCCAISSLAFACHFAFVVISPVLLMGDLGLSEHGFAIVFAGYGLAYVVGGLVAGKLNALMPPTTQIYCGLAFLGFAGLMLLTWRLFASLSIASLMLPVIISSIGVTIIRPSATTYALRKHSARAGAAASVSNTLLLATGGVVSTLIASVDNGLSFALASLFFGASLVGGLLLFYLKQGERSARVTATLTKEHENVSGC